MYLQFIKQDFSEITSEERYFFATFLKNFGVDRISSLSVKEFALGFGMTTYLVTKSISRLRRHEFLCLQAAGQRQSRKYKVSPKLKKQLKKYKVECQCKHRELIARVLSNASLGSRETNQSDLKIQSRLLLVVLLLFADKYGEVKSVGRSKLQKLTGMDSDRLSSHVNKLVLAGYVIHHLPGMTCSSLFGICNSTYILDVDLIAAHNVLLPHVIGLEDNILHQGKFYKQLRLTIKTRLAAQDTLIDKAKCRIQAELGAFSRLIDKNELAYQVRLADQAKLIAQARLTVQTRIAFHAQLIAKADIKAIKDAFPKFPRVELLTYIKFKREEYALSILRLLDCAKETDQELIYEILKDKIKADLFPDSHVINEYRLPSTKELRDIMAKDFFNSSFRLAKLIIESADFKLAYEKIKDSKCVCYLKLFDARSVQIFFKESHVSQ